MNSLFSFKITSFADDRSILKNMKTFNILLVILAVAAWGNPLKLQAQDNDYTGNQDAWTTYGASFSPMEPESGQALLDFYESLEEESSESVQFKGKVSSVCQVKGCWMVVDLINDEQVRITFKDYGFFVPTDIVGKEVVVNGQAEVSEISEEDQRHYARDEGLSEQEINAIRGSKRTYTLVADGVMLNQ